MAESTLSNNVSLRMLYDKNALLDLSSHTVFDDAQSPDSLRCLAFDRLANIIDYHKHVVSQGEEGSFDLLSFDYYGTERLYWVIMAYNGLANFTQVLSGMTLKIPVANQVRRVLTDVTANYSSSLVSDSRRGVRVIQL